MNNKLPALDDLRVLLAVVRQGSFTAAARELGSSTPYITKRIHALEAELGAPLLLRTTRQVALTEPGARVLVWAQRLLDDMDGLLQDVSAAAAEPRGALRIVSSFGFGRRVVAPAIAQLAAQHPQLQIRLEVHDRLVDVTAEGVDLDVRVGDEIAPHLIARRLADNHRVLCAAPTYLAARGTPQHLAELAQHACLVIKERDHPVGLWRLTQTGDPQVHTAKVGGALSTNHGEVAVAWALAGAGIVLRSRWDVATHLASGRLVQVLPAYRQVANVWAVYPARLAHSAKLRVAVAFLAERLPALLAAPLP